MAWKKYFKDANLSPISGDRSPQFAKRNYSSYLPDVYTGHPNRVQRYFQYDQMDSDSEVNAALDILAEFCTQSNKENETPFDIVFKDDVTESEVKLLKKALQQWTKANRFAKRIFRIFRNTLKYGDCFFVRDNETNKWLYIDPAKVDRIIVNESDGKVPEQYIIRDINPNLQRLSATQITPNQLYGGTTGGAYAQNFAGASQGVNASGAGGGMGASGGRFYRTMNQYAINAEHVVHMSLSDGLDNLFPFGQSVLEQVFKVFKQKELLEDAIIIYRVQRAPERRVFYIDVGNMPTHLAMQFVERVKNEINQRRIPTTAGGANHIDATYNPMSMNEDYFFPQTAEGRGSKVDTLPGGTNLGSAFWWRRAFTNRSGERFDQWILRSGRAARRLPSGRRFSFQPGRQSLSASKAGSEKSPMATIPNSTGTSRGFPWLMHQSMAKAFHEDNRFSHHWRRLRRAFARS